MILDYGLKLILSGAINFEELYGCIYKQALVTMLFLGVLEVNGLEKATFLIILRAVFRRNGKELFQARA